MATTTPPVEAPAEPSATIDAAPLTPGSAQLVPEQGSPTVDQPDVSASGQLQDSLPLQTPSVPNVEAAVEAEEVAEGVEYETDNDSGYSFEDTGSSTTSLADSVRQYRQENGRTYHSFREGVYAMPNDEFEQERLADEHPEAQVIGIDLSPIQPGFVPPNLKFVVDDAEDEWVISEKFDLIHVRMMVGSFLDWPKFFTRCYNQLHPGAFIEVQDVTGLGCDDTTFTYDPPSCRFAEWWHLVTKAFKESGRDMDAAAHHKERLEEAGFINVKVVDFKWPINTWPRDKKLKTIGMWSKENTLDALEALAMAPLTRVLKWTPEEVQLLLQGARIDIENEGIHAYWNIRAVYGERPE
ncbi:hypothetical protein VE00_02802 [Pseudogymnoascus sp. WSF 3629]|nr:hypothetical protein VE00_02802 [Pseudogymnoascus sp. WSF 3629]